MWEIKEVRNGYIVKNLAPATGHILATYVAKDRAEVLSLIEDLLQQTSKDKP